MASYPSAIVDTTTVFTTKTNTNTVIDASHVNYLQDEVRAIEIALGTNPQQSTNGAGTYVSAAQNYSTLAARLNNYDVGIIGDVHTQYIRKTSDSANIISTGAVGVKGLIIKAVSGQTANLQEWQDSSGAVVAAISPTGGLSSSSSVANLTLTSAVLTSPIESWNINTTAPTGALNIDLLTSTVWYYTTSATANFTLNFRGNSTTPLTSGLSVGQSVTVAVLVTNSTTGYYPTSFTIDGTSQPIKWQNGAAPTVGNTSATDIYTFTIVKTAATPTYTALASLTKFAQVFT